MGFYDEAAVSLQFFSDQTLQHNETVLHVHIVVTPLSLHLSSKALPHLYADHMGTHHLLTRPGRTTILWTFLPVFKFSAATKFFEYSGSSVLHSFYVTHVFLFHSYEGSF